MSKQSINIFMNMNLEYHLASSDRVEAVFDGCRQCLTKQFQGRLKQRLPQIWSAIDTCNDIDTYRVHSK